jgi:hypothetical protein
MRHPDKAEFAHFTIEREFLHLNMLELILN